MFSSPVGFIFPKSIWTTSSANSKSQQMALHYKETLPWCQLPSPQLYKFNGESQTSLCLRIILLSSYSCFFPSLVHSHYVSAEWKACFSWEQSQKEAAQLYVTLIFIHIALFQNPLPPCGPSGQNNLHVSTATVCNKLIITVVTPCML